MIGRALAWTLTVLFFFAALACSGGDGEELGDGDPATDGDGDVDSDVDADADTDADTDSDGSADIDAFSGSGDGSVEPDGSEHESGSGHDGGRDPDASYVVDGDCLEACTPCTFGVDDCCGNYTCKDDWSGETFCVPVVDPNTNGCPSSEPEEGSACEELGILCRFTGANRCRCGCAGWECPFGD